LGPQLIIFKKARGTPTAGWKTNFMPSQGATLEKKRRKFTKKTKGENGGQRKSTPKADSVVLLKKKARRWVVSP